ncbi:MAG TPA: serine/threonine-protein kinase [Ktedonosporobacter sp.]|nr:serine/threonine-protein kinase [Ktedonosporobacter sp.]
MSDRVGQRLGNYQLIQLLGRGGFAEVYLGEHRHLETQAAIKLLYTHIATSEEEPFLAEARTIAHLEHPHIVRILDFDVHEGIPFLVMSYAPNGTLRQCHPRGTRLPTPLVRGYLQQVASALQYAHEQKVIHRDIKPENILLGRHNELLLSDFGIALIAQSSRLVSTQNVVGTASYMAPEQLQGKPRQASDQYALAVMVYEWLAGERPFQGTFLELYSQHLSVPPPSLREKVATLSPEVDQVIQTALAKDPAQRFASVKAFATALEHAITAPPSPAHFITRGTPPQSPISSRDRIPPSVPIALPVDVKQVPPINTGSESLVAAVSSDQHLAPSLSPPLTEGITTITPPATKVVTSPRQRRGLSRRTVIAGLATTLTVVGGGAWVLLSRWPFVGEGTPLYIYQGHSNTVNTVAWSPNGKRIASGSSDNTVQVWNAIDGSSPYTYRGHSNTANAVAWSPDGKQITSGSSDNTVQV